MSRKVTITTIPTIGFDPSLEPADDSPISPEAMHMCRAWWPYSLVMRESMARVLERFAEQRPISTEKYNVAVLGWQARAGCTLEEAADDVAFVFEMAGMTVKMPSEQGERR